MTIGRSPSRALGVTLLGVVLVASSLLGACSRGRGANASTTPDGPAPVVDPETTTPAGGGEPATSAPLTDAECMRLIDHVLAIGLAQQRAAKAPELVPTEEQVAEIRAQLADELLPECLAQPRAAWQCGMRAADRDELAACAPAP